MYPLYIFLFLVTCARFIWPHRVHIELITHRIVSSCECYMLLACVTPVLPGLPKSINPWGRPQLGGSGGIPISVALWRTGEVLFHAESQATTSDVQTNPLPQHNVHLLALYLSRSWTSDAWSPRCSFASLPKFTVSHIKVYSTCCHHMDDVSATRGVFDAVMDRSTSGWTSRSVRRSWWSTWHNANSWTTSMHRRPTIYNARSGISRLWRHRWD